MPPLPTADSLVALVRASGPDALDAFRPEIDELVDTVTLAEWLGIQPRTIYRERNRKRAQRPPWPVPDRIIGRSPAWTYRTIVIHRAGASRRKPPAPP